MALSTVASILLGIGMLLTLLAGGLWLRAWRGRVTSWRSCCSRCGFELRGLNPLSTVCPECGADLQAAAALRPATRQRDPWRWSAAAAMSLLALMTLWLGTGSRLLQGGVWICRALPTSTLIELLPTAPRFAGPQLAARLRSGGVAPTQLDALALAAADAALRSAPERVGDAMLLLTQLQQMHLLSPERLPALLERCLAGVALQACKPVCKPGGAIVISVTLPPTQATSWITRDELRMSIDSVQARLGDAPEQSLERLTRTGQSGTREFDGTIFRAPASPGHHQCTMTVLMRQPGDAPGSFSMRAQAKFEMVVIDPASIRVQFVTNAEFAGAVRTWLESARLDVDAATQRVAASLPVDVGTLQRGDIAVAARLLAEQGEISIDLGRVWIDATIPMISLTPAPLPAALDRSKPVTLVLAPDADLAAQMTSTDCNALADRVDVQVKLPPPPPAPEPAAAASAPSTAPATS